MSGIVLVALVLVLAACDRDGSGPTDAIALTIAGAGRDLDGYGLPDVAVGAPLNGPEGLPSMGQVVVLPGSVTGVHSADAFPVRIDSDRPFAHLGHTLASLGDIDGDGQADLALGAPDNCAGERRKRT